MKVTVQALLLLGVAVGFAAASQSADAAQRLRKNETYCLDTPMGGAVGGGGGTYLDCRFETMQQCYASRLGIGGTCMLNPVIAFSERGRAYHNR